MYNDQLVYKVVIWAFFGISLWKEKVALNNDEARNSNIKRLNIQYSTQSWVSQANKVYKLMLVNAGYSDLNHQNVKSW